MKQARVKYDKIIATMYFKDKIYLRKPQYFLIFLYGLLSKPLDDRSPIIKKLVEKGFSIICPEYIGTFSSYGKCNFKNSIDTVLQTIKFLKKGKAKNLWSGDKFIWKTKEIVLIGGSYGGSIALVAAARSEVRNIVAAAPVIDWKEHFKQKKYNLYGIIKRGFGNVWRINKKYWKKFVEGKLNLSPIEYIRFLKDKNILLIHGKKDRVVSINKTNEFYEMLKKGGGNHKKIVLTNEGHVELKIFENSRILGSFLLWLKNNSSGVN